VAVITAAAAIDVESIENVALTPVCSSEIGASGRNIGEGRGVPIRIANAYRGAE
jgi:hypothetical protein